MRTQHLTQYVVAALLLAVVACGRNTSSGNVDASTVKTDTTGVAAIPDSARANQTESGMTDSSGQSTLGPEADKTRPDQGQPVTSKGDTVNAGIDSSSTSR
jgi:hypothetical protein